MGRDRRIVERVCRWFGARGRALPWRTSPRDPYRSLVSELMLQQTQVSRVVERFGPFVRRFPSVGALARAREQDVLAAWSGMGYYRRARHLHAAAREIETRFGGRVPQDAAALRTLPGVGRYTAGAVASIVFGRAEPVVDGNVARVLLRIEGREGRHQDPAVMSWAWERSASLQRRTGGQRCGPGDFNEGLMELGAVVCTPRRPRCAECPLSRLCRARRDGRQEEIPAPKARAARTRVYCAAARVRDARGRMLVRRRGEGMWAGLWEAPTVEGSRRATRRQVEDLGVAVVRRAESFAFATTHRDLRFDVWEAGAPNGTPRGCTWKTVAQVRRLALSSPQQRILLGR